MNTFKRISLAFAVGTAAALALPLFAILGLITYIRQVRVQLTKINDKFKKYEQA